MAESKILELHSMAGEEMNLLTGDPGRARFLDGEKTLAAQILALIDGAEDHVVGLDVEPVEEEMVLDLGRT